MSNPATLTAELARQVTHLEGDLRRRATTLTELGEIVEVVTHSEPRLERVLDLLGEVLPGGRVVNEERRPLAPGELPVPPKLSGEDVVLEADTLAQIQDLLERRWLEESIPALGGLTPRQAADDPTRPEELLRLIASFPGADGLPSAQVGIRPARLRDLLGF